MSFLGTIIAVAVIGSTALVLKFRQSEKRMAEPLGDFGDIGEHHNISSEVARVLIAQYSRQQSLAFGVVCFAAGLGVVLAGTVVVGIILDAISVGEALLGGLGAIGEGWLWKRALGLYSSASERLEQLVETTLRPCIQSASGEAPTNIAGALASTQGSN